MSRARELLQQLVERRDLSQPQAEELLACLTDPQLPPALAGALLAALATKGLVAAEVRGFARAMRGLAERPPLPAALRAVSTFPPAPRCSPRPAVCRWSSTAIARSPAAAAVPMYSRHSA
jgi:anthranilate phosphoribosyltransferase